MCPQANLSEILLGDKVAGRKIVSAPEPSRPTGGKIIDLMVALKRSLGQDAETPAAKPAKAEAKSKKSV